MSASDFCKDNACNNNETVNQCYKRLARTIHPDKIAQREGREATQEDVAAFQVLDGSYRTLKDKGNDQENRNCPATDIGNSAVTAPGMGRAPANQESQSWIDLIGKLGGKAIFHSQLTMMITAGIFMIVIILSHSSGNSNTTGKGNVFTQPGTGRWNGGKKQTGGMPGKFISLIVTCLTVFLMVLGTLQNFALNYPPAKLQGMDVAIVFQKCVGCATPIASIHKIPITNTQELTITNLIEKKGAIEDQKKLIQNKIDGYNLELKIPGTDTAKINDLIKDAGANIKTADDNIKTINAGIVSLNNPKSIFHEMVGDFKVQINEHLVPRIPGNIRQGLEVRGALSEGNTPADIFGREIQALDAAATALNIAVSNLNLQHLDGLKGNGNYKPLLNTNDAKVFITPRNVTEEVNNFYKKTKQLLDKTAVKDSLLAPLTKELLKVKIYGEQEDRAGVRTVSKEEMRDDMEKRAFADIHLAIADSMEYSDGITFAKERTATRLAINIAYASKELMESFDKPASQGNQISTVNSLKNLEVLTSLMMEQNAINPITDANIAKYIDLKAAFKLNMDQTAHDNSWSVWMKSKTSNFFGFFGSVAAEATFAVVDEGVIRLMQSFSLITDGVVNYVRNKPGNTAILAAIIYFVIGQVATIMGAAFRGNTNADPLKAIKDAGEGIFDRLLPPAKTEAEQRIDLERLRLEVERERLTLERELRISNGPLGIAPPPLAIDNGLLGIGNGPLGIANGPLGIGNGPAPIILVPPAAAAAPILPGPPAAAAAPIILVPPAAAAAPILPGPPAGAVAGDEVIIPPAPDAGGNRATKKRGKHHSKRNAKGAPRKTKYARNKATRKKRRGRK